LKNKAIKILKIVIPIGIGIYLTWYFSVIGLVISIILSQRNLVGKVMPFQDSIHIIMNVLVVTINGYLWVIKLL
jgi:hypothetical protein